MIEIEIEIVVGAFRLSVHRDRVQVGWGKTLI